MDEHEKAGQADEFVAEDNRRKIAERVVHHVRASSANAAEADVYLNLVASARRLRHVHQRHVVFAGRVFDECLPECCAPSDMSSIV